MTSARSTHRGKAVVRFGLSPAAILASVVAAILTAAVVFLATGGLRREPYQEWVTISAAFRENLTYVAPICAGVTAFAVARLYRRNSALTSAAAPRAGIRQAVRPVMCVAAFSIAGLIVGFLPLLAQTADTATDGGPAMGPILTALVYLWFCAVIGGLAGVALPLIPATLVAIAVSFITTNIILWLGDSWWPVGPVLGQSPQPGQVESSAVIAHRIVLVLAVSAVLLVLMHHLADRTSSRSQVLAAVSLAVVVIVVGLLVSVGRYNALYTFENSPTSVCEQTQQGTRVCMHRAHERDLAAAVAAVANVQRRFPVPTRELVPDQLIDQSLAYVIPPDEVGNYLVVRIAPGGGDAAGKILSNAISGLARCDFSGNASPSLGLSSDIDLWLSGTSLEGSAQSALKGLTTEQIRSGIRAAAHELQQCTLTPQRFVRAAREARP